MALFWILQGLLDITIVGLAISYVLQRRRLLALEHELRFALARLDGSDARPPSLEKSLNTPLGSALSTLSERRASPTDGDTTSLSTAGRYTLAQKLLAEGHPLGEVAKRTSISQTELVLLKKLSQNQFAKNYDAH